MINKEHFENYFQPAYEYQNVVVLTGAGISAESGLNTFRGEGGLWEGHPVEDVATPEAFERDPSLVYKFYNMRRRDLHKPIIKPNAAHVALAKFEKNFTGNFLLVTQNVDNLHERAQSLNLRHMHGALLSVKTLRSGKAFPWTKDLDASCRVEGIDEPLRPDIVWFGEMPYHMDEIIKSLEKCDLFVAIGTSGHVYPASGFVSMVPPSCDTVEINLEATTVGSRFKRVIKGKASETVPEFFKVKT